MSNTVFCIYIVGISTDVSPRKQCVGTRSLTVHNKANRHYSCSETRAKIDRDGMPTMNITANKYTYN